MKDFGSGAIIRLQEGFSTFSQTSRGRVRSKSQSSISMLQRRTRIGPRFIKRALKRFRCQDHLVPCEIHGTRVWISGPFQHMNERGLINAFGWKQIIHLNNAPLFIHGVASSPPDFTTRRYEIWQREASARWTAKREKKRNQMMEACCLAA